MNGLLVNTWKRYEGQLEKTPKYSESNKRTYEKAIEKHSKKAKGSLQKTISNIDECHEEIGVLLRENEKYEHGDRDKIFKQLDE